MTKKNLESRNVEKTTIFSDPRWSRRLLVKNLLDQAPFRIFIKDLNSVYIYCNPLYAADLGITPKQIVGKNDFDFFPLELAEKYIRDDREIMAAGQNKRIIESYKVGDEERWVRTHKIPYRNEHGHIIGILGIFEDITKQKQAEDRYRIQANRFHALLEATFEGYWLAGGDTRILEVNERACAMSGYTRDEMLQMKVTDLDTIVSPEETEQRMAAFMEKGYALFETKHRRKDGSIIDVEINATSFHSEGGTLIFSFLRDITQMKKVAEYEKNLDIAMAANRARNVFLSNMGHELRAPLNAIIGFSKILTEEPSLSSKHLEQVKIINRSATRLIRDLNALFDMAKDEAGQFGLQVETFDLLLLLEDMVKDYRQMCITKGLTMTVMIEDSVPWYVTGDHEKLRWIFNNLLENAVKFTDQGGIILRVWDLPVEENEVRLMVEVDDSGTGIAEEKSNIIFRTIDYVDFKETKDGLGIGLPMSRIYVER